MKIVDSNILLYAVNQEMPLHNIAREWLDNALSQSETVGFAWLALLSFVRVSTRRGVFTTPLTSDQALDIVRLWLSQPTVTVVEPTRRHLAVVQDLLKPLGVAGNLVPDAHLAALAIEHGATMCSFDNDFSRFAGLQWLDPSKPHN